MDHRHAGRGNETGTPIFNPNENDLDGFTMIPLSDAKAGLLPFLSFVVYYDAENQVIGLKKRD